MNTSNFRKYQLKHLSTIIGVKPEKLSFILSNIDVYYKERKEVKMDTRTNKPKTYLDGTPKFRVIRPSFKDLKFVQKRIKALILAPIPLPKNIHGGVKKKSNITNAKIHQGKKYIFTTDLQDFYPSISSSAVFDTFLNIGFTDSMANYLTKLTTWKYELPQGAPTSTHVSNLFFLRTDYELIKFCDENSITYTRYIDDLTFSSQYCFKCHTSKLLEIIKDTSDLKLSHRKINYGGKQKVTGIYVYNNKIDAPESIIALAIDEVFNNLPDKPYNDYLNRIRKTNVKRYKNL